ncbi:MAG: family 43 glycosylhydrolase [Acidobacteria bacterium]|nr:family 43 glycosylhydrolase [Acidobacteriota bacterium]
MVTLLVYTSSALAQSSRHREFRNPVIDADFPDPTVIRAHDGYFYAYATESIVNGMRQHVQVARSSDLVSWQRLPDALPTPPTWADPSSPDTWVPDVIEADGKYFLYYAAEPIKRTGKCLAVATSDRPEGPFRDVGKPLKCGEGFVNIDPMAFDDPKTGKHLLYWGSGFQPIKVQELSRSRLEFASQSEPIDLVWPIKNNDPTNYQLLVEGAWVVYRNGYYYLFFSGDNCCGDKAHYAVMVARSKRAEGPFETFGDAAKRKNSVILEMGADWVAPGHNSVIRDDNGRDWIVYHAIPARGRDRRAMLISPLTYRRGWVYVTPSTPTSESQTAPFVRGK